MRRRCLYGHCRHPGAGRAEAGHLAHDRLDVAQFRRWTLVLLVLTGANLIRRAVEIAAAGL